MKVQSGIVQLSIRAALTATCIAAAAMGAHAQDTITVFPPVNVRLSSSAAGYGENQVVVNSSTLILNCPSSNLRALVSSTRDGSGNVLVDNFVNLTVTQGEGTPTGPFNICRGGIVENGNQQDCFTAGYQGPASQGQLTGLNPDGFASSGGVAPIDISASLAPGSNQVKVDVVDTGGYLASSSIYLYTSCKFGGVTGPAQISGNPIPSTNPSPAQLKQSFTFNPGHNRRVQQTLDLSFAQTANTLTIANGTIPITADIAIDPTRWQPDYVKGTSFATSNCLIHDGEMLNGKPACKLYTVTCQIGQGAVATGAQCPVSSARNEVFEDSFDGPAFTLPDIPSAVGTFHQGIGYVMASEGWEGGACTFDQASGLSNDLCPKNLLTLFTGPGAYGGKGTTNHPNSAFISIAPVPEDLTSVTFNFSPLRTWVNRRTVKANLASKPPIVPKPNNDFVAAPITSITYGLSLANAVPSTEFPVATDTVLTNSVGCPAPGDSGHQRAEYFHPPDQMITVPEDGKYLVHYFATDCAGTQELKFRQDSSGSWHTTFYTVALNVDTVPPNVPKSPTLTPAPTLIHGVLGYAVGQKVTAHYHCSDDRSGVEWCASTHYANPVADPPAGSEFVDTSKPGSKTFVVTAQDAARNQGVPRSVTYTVVAAQ